MLHLPHSLHICAGFFGQARKVCHLSYFNTLVIDLCILNTVLFFLFFWYAYSSKWAECAAVTALSGNAICNILQWLHVCNCNAQCSSTPQHFLNIWREKTERSLHSFVHYTMLPRQHMFVFNAILLTWLRMNEHTPFWLSVYKKGKKENSVQEIRFFIWYAPLLSAFFRLRTALYTT